ncbi:MAG: hypothetical protein Q4E53_01425 [Eubacteriales bacterium]|nr:hypothetical protein [Eubacteriales bacterium]
MLNAMLRVEFLREGRSIRLPILIIFINSILAFMTILFIFFNNESTQVGYYAGRSTFLAQFLIISTFQIAIIFLLMPFFVSSIEENEESISDHLLMIPGIVKYYVASKVYISVATSLLVFVSSLPIISLSCIYSGLSLMKMVRLFGTIFLLSFWSSSIAVFFYSLGGKVFFSFIRTIFAYFMFSFGIILLLEIIRAADLSISSSGEISAAVRNLSMALNLLNPLTVYAGYYGNVVGNTGYLSSYFGNYGVDVTGTTFSFLYYKLAAVFCGMTGVAFLYMSVRFFRREK